mgnify:CR=1 FL=1
MLSQGVIDKIQKCRNYLDSKSKENDKYLKIVSESMSGTSEEETNKNYNKIFYKSL